MARPKSRPALHGTAWPFGVTVQPPPPPSERGTIMGSGVRKQPLLVPLASHSKPLGQGESSQSRVQVPRHRPERHSELSAHASPRGKPSTKQRAPWAVVSHSKPAGQGLSSPQSLVQNAVKSPSSSVQSMLEHCSSMMHCVPKGRGCDDSSSGMQLWHSPVSSHSSPSPQSPAPGSH